MLAYGNCSYGDRCKFSHDVSSAKPKTVFDYIPQEISLNTEQDRTWYSQQPAAGYLKDFNEFPEWKFTCYSEDEDGKTFTDTSTDEVRWLAYKANNEKTLNQFVSHPLSCCVQMYCLGLQMVLKCRWSVLQCRWRV
eukprot:TRINITY_DN9348_c0_g1_i2.p1 TRINITY_DN9348_c0_g1~~TRINITY_DN9348_c0_g1_i2.p1  ORF type:complete len:149 (+),score=5.24 TRINITY_DN9348_c0_g1_i2:42-449(+)